LPMAGTIRQGPAGVNGPIYGPVYAPIYTAFTLPDSSFLTRAHDVITLHNTCRLK
jgi:hypothetical protein